MADGVIPDKGERLKEFYRRLGDARAAVDANEAYGQVCDLLNEVEDELSGIPCDPASSANDGRMYPPQADSIRPTPGRLDVTRYRSRLHSTMIGDNGAIRVIDHNTGGVIFDKPGADGLTIG